MLEPWQFGQNAKDICLG